MKVKELTQFIEQLYPLAFQESYDNSGSQIFFPNEEIKNILLCLDITEAVVDEATSKECNLIISHHPIFFKSLKEISDQNMQGRMIIKSIQNRISLYSVHTNFDASWEGTNRILCDLLKLENIEILSPVQHQLKKLVTFVPVEFVEKVRQAIFEAGAGVIGNYDSCSFNAEGYGTFRANKNTNPFVGKVGELHQEPELRIETVFPSFLQERIVDALLSAHPYEEVAYDIYLLENTYQKVGIGMVGYLHDPMSLSAFLAYIKDALKCRVLKTNNSSKDIIQKVSVCSGSGASFVNLAIKNKVDAFITADLKYHDFTECPSHILLVDAGHYETEIHFVRKMFEIITQKYTNFATYISENSFNLVNYF